MENERYEEDSKIRVTSNYIFAEYINIKSDETSERVSILEQVQEEEE